MRLVAGAAVVKTVALGRTGITCSAVGLGTSALGGEFGEVPERDAMDTVASALAAGITLFDSAPAYGSTSSETRLGKALSGVPRDAYVLSTKAGKTTDETGRDHFDFSADAIRLSVEGSLERLGVDRIDIVHLHDFEREGGAHLEQALGEGMATLRELRDDGRVGAVGAGIYALDVWKRVLSEASVDVVLVHNHHTLCDIRAYELLPLAEARGIGVLNAAPFASGLLTGDTLPPWHPAPAWAVKVVREAATVAAAHDTTLARLALAYAIYDPRLPVTVFSCSDPGTLRRNLRWAAEPVDWRAVAEVQRALEPIMNRQWDFG